MHLSNLLVPVYRLEYLERIRTWSINKPRLWHPLNGDKEISQAVLSPVFLSPVPLPLVQKFILPYQNPHYATNSTEPANRVSNVPGAVSTTS